MDSSTSKNVDKCHTCRIVAPGFVTHFFCNGGYLYVCPVCALRIRNKVHGLPLNTPFQGEVAKQLYEDFIKWTQKKKKYFDLKIKNLLISIPKSYKKMPIYTEKEMQEYMARLIFRNMLEDKLFEEELDHDF